MQETKNDPNATDMASILLDIRDYEQLIQELEDLRETEKRYENLIFHLKFWSSYATISLLFGLLYKTNQPNSFLIGVGYGVAIAPFLIALVSFLADKFVSALRKL